MVTTSLTPPPSAHIHVGRGTALVLPAAQILEALPVFRVPIIFAQKTTILATTGSDLQLAIEDNLALYHHLCTERHHETGARGTTQFKEDSQNRQHVIRVVVTAWLNMKSGVACPGFPTQRYNSSTPILSLLLETYLPSCAKKCGSRKSRQGKNLGSP